MVHFLPINNNSGFTTTYASGTQILHHKIKTMKIEIV